jgi:3-hydroxyacyl-CoA dehydrogenase
MVDEMIVKRIRTSKASSAARSAMQEIVERLVFALVNEGALILEEGIASKASDIDMVYLTGYGFPLYRGGPMLYADTVGLYNVERAMRKLCGASERRCMELRRALPSAATGRGFNGSAR